MYVFNINTYSENYDFLESGTAYAYMIASDFSAFNCFVYHAAVSTPTIINIEFTTSKVVPDGSVKGNTIDR